MQLETADTAKGILRVICHYLTLRLHKKATKNVMNHYCCEIPYFLKTIKYQSVASINCSWH
jgi:hypothetical protein